MPDAAGNIKGIALSGKAGEVLDRIKRKAQEDEGYSHQFACLYPNCSCEGHQNDCPGV